MTALDRGEALPWEAVIEKPYEFPREKPERVPKLEVIPKPDPSEALQTLRDRLQGIKGNPENFTAKCPGHEDHENSLQVKRLDGGKVSVQCFAGCEIGDVLAPLGMKPRDLYPDEQRATKPQIERTYTYTDAAGRMVFQVVRYRPKQFRQRRPDPTKPGGWAWSLDGIDRPLYNLPEVLKAKAEGQTIYLVEGEKDADNLKALGLCATTNAGGAGKWQQSFTDTLAGADVVIFPDNDEPGLKAAQARHKALPGSVVVTLPDVPHKGDVSDWLAQGGAMQALQALVAQARANPEVKAEAKEILPLSDMRGWREMAAEPLDNVFEEHMLAGTFALIAAPGGVGKSFFALQLGISVALGQEIIPGLTPTRRGPVLLCFGEDKEHAVSRRIASICRTFGIAPDEIDRAINDGLLQFICGRRARLLDFTIPTSPRMSAAHAEILARCADNKYRLVVIDPVIKWAGLPDENSNPAQELAASAMIELAEASKCGVCLAIHHANKQSARSGDSSQTASRGGSALPDASRWMGGLSQVDDVTLKKAGLDPEQEICRFTFAKNTNGPTRRNRPIYLERCEGGALRFIDLAEAESSSLLAAIVAELRAKPVELTAREMYKSTGKIAEEFRERVAAKVPDGTKTGNAAFQTAINGGIQTGILSAVPHPENENRHIIEVAK